MTNIEKLKDDKKKDLADLDTAIWACEPECQTRMQNVDKVQNKFLTIWKQYKNQKVPEQQFLEISKNFAKILESEQEMFVSIRNILRPLDMEFKKACDSLDNLENNNERMS